MDRKLSVVLAFCLGYGALDVQAETMGERSLLDSRVQTALYNPDNVYRVQAKIGRTSSIQLPPNETVMGRDGVITSGDPKAWELGLNQTGNLITLKPIEPDDPDTNFTINSNRHTYLIEMKLVKNLSDMTYLLRFKHPDRPKPVPFDLVSDPCSGLRSGPYQKRGEKSLSPSEAWDNGTFTCFRFPTNLPRPVIYQVLPDGTETLANVRPVRDILVVHSVSHLFRLRLNGLVMEMKPTQALGSSYNFNGTTTGEVREVKRAEQ
ncbi:TrbG/VirB9 family P-type conjugative transfer protein [Pseudomonas fluorescens]|uniref:Conjugal transfer protein n=1 Tax=Pseudomonas fluorescens TaxID=294 RepID=A0A2T0HNE2_PSEFL|nr:TrbG/VirB9 family P-type conjugative transfer protein [Pseudomonas fluorescens]PRW84483.1 conjugal transfer protein [Pseudomonas fluorescens]